MVTAVAVLTIHIPQVHTLKEKRSVVKSIIGKVKARYNVSIIEAGYNDKWQKSEIGISLCAISMSDANKNIENIIRYVEENFDIQLLHKDITYM